MLGSRCSKAAILKLAGDVSPFCFAIASAVYNSCGISKSCLGSFACLAKISGVTKVGLGLLDMLFAGWQIRKTHTKLNIG